MRAVGFQASFDSKSHGERPGIEHVDSVPVNAALTERSGTGGRALHATTPGRSVSVDQALLEKVRQITERVSETVE
jgi:hypothetical protein